MSKKEDYLKFLKFHREELLRRINSIKITSCDDYESIVELDSFLELYNDCDRLINALEAV